MIRHFVSTMILMCSWVSLAQGHGLTLSEGKTLLYDRIGDIMVKVELSPHDLQFNQENVMELSVIDIDKGGIFDRSISLKIDLLQEDNKTSNIFSGEYQKGIFKEIINFQSGGAHKIELTLDKDNIRKKKVFNFAFELKDNRPFAYTATVTTIVFFSIFTCIIGLTIIYRRKQ